MTSSFRDKINQFVKNLLVIHPETETVILTGSYVLDKATKHSDVDLCLIGSFDSFKRMVTHHNDIEFQIICGSWNWYEEVVTSFERKDNQGTITRVLSHSICIHGCNERWLWMYGLANKYFQEGPPSPTSEKIRKIRFDITGLWGNYVDEDEVFSKQWIGFNLVRECVKYRFLSQRWWEIKAKYQLEELKMKDPVMRNLLDQCFLSQCLEPKSIKDICEYVLEPIGGWLVEDWSN